MSLYVLLLLAAVHPATAAPPQQKETQSASDTVDVGILVHSLSADSARVAVAYQHPVAHVRVRDAINRLAKASGWIPGELLIVDDRINRDPKTTTALFTLRQSPQVNGGAPALQPYLTAFQSWNRVEVLFLRLSPEPARSAAHFDSSALSVQLEQGGQGVLRYVADIRDHTGVLPIVPLTQEQAVNRQQLKSDPLSPPVVKHPSDTVNSLPLLLTVMGAALIGGTVTYLALLRRMPPRSSARILRS